MAEATRINDAIVPPETMAQHERWQAGWFKGREIRYGEDVAALLAMGAAVPQRDRETLRRQLATAFAEGADLLITPTVPMTATRPGQATVDLGGEERELLGSVIHFLCGFSLTGVPTLALPTGLAPDGLPVSVQLIGPHLHDPRVLAAGMALEASLGPMPRPSLAA
jgi:Asp-tRNA(Asn)/Glu-tRNA(Gln) amidotransferase A subunit family amidase